MSKELEACFKEIYHEIEYVYDSKVCSKVNKNWSNDIKHYDNIRGNVLTIQRYLESIDNATPSEALECLDRCYDQLVCESDNELEFKTIKQYILKTQEPKQYLTWEDLEFDVPTSLQATIKVKMGDTLYLLSLRVSFSDVKSVVLRDNNLKPYLHLFEKEKQFFNDLRLERVE